MRRSGMRDVQAQAGKRAITLDEALAEAGGAVAALREAGAIRALRPDGIVTALRVTAAETPR